MLAAEAIWGATVQVINAANHARGRRSHANNTRERFRALQYLEDKYHIGEQLKDGFAVALRQLHNHFYGGYLSESTLADSLVAGRRFVFAMIELAEMEMAELGSTESASESAP